MQANIMFDARDIVGESIIWSDHEQALYWVDIGGKRIHRLEVGGGRHDAWPTPDFPTSIGMRANGGFIVGLAHEVCLWTPDGRFETLAVPEPSRPGNRLNEGRVAPDGSFWVSTMQNNLNPDGTPKDMDGHVGAVYRVDAAGAVSRLTPNEYGITNTMAWTSTGRFLFADTLANEIYAFDYDAATKTLANRRTIVSGFERGLPDGSCLDSEDALWNCRVVGGAAVARFSETGEQLGLVELPVSWPTSCAFGGKDLTTLYITSARFTMTAQHLEAHPQEGSLLAVETGIRGAPEWKFAG
ncbi:SMP-30/gluconolactonase/LRE family protein [Rhizobium sp. G21]|uniref:SMP-30/gluconolactonase/LRE family protein n=1 Tax=Rhizobium sp. G21 TaxID=2758439 RepID=UPI001602B632|nr:SMP-30/gluconolactonase/LRE family protein [Rhizobium sp. G21]MBB1251554.1 SMP-30/gluconolactonase/LRE family protein [Rhizobium sp. G21]